MKERYSKLTKIPKLESQNSNQVWLWVLYSFIYFILFILCFRASPTAYGSSQARGRIRAVAAGLHHSHSNTESKPGLRAPPQLTAILDSRPTEQGQGLNPHPHGYELDSFLLSHKGNSLYSFCFGSQPPTLAQMRKGPFLSSPPIIPWSSSLLLSAYFPSFH